MSPRRLLGLLFLLLLALFYVYAARQDFGYLSDTAYYLGLADALSEGEGYRFNGRWHTRYPPGWPLLLGVGRVFGAGDGLLSRLTALLGVTGLLVFWRYCSARGERLAGVFVVLLGLSTGLAVVATNGPRSDMPYLLLSLLALLWAERLGPQRSGRLVAVAAGGAVLAAAAVAVRSVGIALVLGMLATLLHELLRRRRGAGMLPARAVVALGIAAVAGAASFAAWTAWSDAHRFPFYAGEFMDSYLQQLRMVDPHRPDLGQASAAAILARVPMNLASTAAHLSASLTNLPFRGLWFSPAVVIPLVLVGLGWVRELRRVQPLAAWYAAAFLATLALWPFDEGLRLVLPIVPVLLLLGAQGARSVRARFATQPVSTTAAGAIAALALLAGSVADGLVSGEWSRQTLASIGVWLGIGSAAIVLLRPRWHRPPFARAAGVAVIALLGGIVVVRSAVGMAALLRVRSTAVVESRQSPIWHAAAWIRANTAAGDTLLAADHEVLHYATGRIVAPLPITRDPAVLRGALRRWRPRYVVINDPQPYEYYAPDEPTRLRLMEAAAAERLHVVHAYPGGRILGAVSTARDRTSPGPRPRASLPTRASAVNLP